MKRSERKTRAMVLTGMMTAVLSVLSILQIPMPTGVPITLQTFAVALCGYLLGEKLGAAAAFLYLLLGTVGVPVFAGMSSGPGVLLGMAGGFIFGFIPMAALCGLGSREWFRGSGLLLGAAGLAVCHLCGCLQYAVLAQAGPLQAFLMVSAPYLVKDLLSVAGARGVALVVRRSLQGAAPVQAKRVGEG